MLFCAADHELTHEGDELRRLVRALHKNGMEIILDVVFNHTAEGNQDGPIFSLKGVDNSIYYLLAPDGTYYNFSGCGNTVNCNHPIVHQMIVACLRYWVIEYRIDGFRFDLASILGRNEADCIRSVRSRRAATAGRSGTESIETMCAASSRVTAAWQHS